MGINDNSKIEDPLALMKGFGIEPTTAGLSGSIESFSRLIHRILEEKYTDVRFDNMATYEPMRISGKLFDILRIKGESGDVTFKVEKTGNEIVFSPVDLHEMQALDLPLSNLIDKLKIRGAYVLAKKEYDASIYVAQGDFEREKATADEEKTLKFLVDTIVNKTKSGDTVPIAGKKRVEELIETQIQGHERFTPGLSDNPYGHISREDIPTIYYQKKKMGEVVDEILLTAMERVQLTSDNEKATYFFQIWREKDNPEKFEDIKERWDRVNRNKKRDFKKEFYEGIDDMTLFPSEAEGVPKAFIDDIKDLFTDKIDERVGIGRNIAEENWELFNLIKGRKTREILESVNTKRPAEIEKLLDYVKHSEIIDSDYKGCIEELIKVEGAGIKIYDSLVKGDKDEVARLVDAARLVESKSVDYGFDITKVIEGINIKGVTDNKMFKHSIYNKIEDRLYNLQSEEMKNFTRYIMVKVKSLKERGKGDFDRATLVKVIEPFENSFTIETLNAIVERIMRLKELIDEKKA